MDKNIETNLEKMIANIDKQTIAQRREQAIKEYEYQVKEIEKQPTDTLVREQVFCCLGMLSTIDAVFLIGRENFMKEYDRIKELKQKRINELEKGE